jgi:carbonyl reductase 1
MDKDTNRSDVVINHVHPGYVGTDMTLHKGPLTPEQGAKSSLFAAALPPNTDVKGRYIWCDCTIVDWVNGPAPPE